MKDQESSSGVVPKIKVQFFGPIREAAKKSGDDLDFSPNINVYSLLRTISGVYGERVHAELLDERSPSGLRDDLIITLNAAVVNHESAAGTGINPGDAVSLFQTFPGGG